jgi:hypothetical protein
MNDSSTAATPRPAEHPITGRYFATAQSCAVKYWCRSHPDTPVFALPARRYDRDDAIEELCRHEVAEHPFPQDEDPGLPELVRLGFRGDFWSPQPLTPRAVAGLMRQGFASQPKPLIPRAMF